MSPLWTSAEAVEATWGVTTQPWTATGVSIDTRTLQPGDLFVALSDVRDGHDFVAQAVVDGLMRAGMDSGVPVLSVSLTPHHYQETEHHRQIFRAHFVEKGREAARAALAIGKVRAAVAA